jgi:hypothetical protein
MLTSTVTVVTSSPLTAAQYVFTSISLIYDFCVLECKDTKNSQHLADMNESFEIY